MLNEHLRATVREHQALNFENRFLSFFVLSVAFYEFYLGEKLEYCFLRSESQNCVIFNLEFANVFIPVKSHI